MLEHGLIDQLRQLNRRMCFSVNRKEKDVLEHGLKRRMCLSMGDSFSSASLLSVLIATCIPVNINDNVQLPFDEVLPVKWGDFSVNRKEKDVLEHGLEHGLMRSVALTVACRCRRNVCGPAREVSTGGSFNTVRQLVQ